MNDEDELLAAELAFGLLAAEEQTEAEAYMARDPAFAAVVDRWRAHAAALAGSPGEAPRPSLWPRIEARLPANDRAPVAASADRWRIIAIAASILAAVMTVVAVERRPATPAVGQLPQTPLVAMLSGGDGKGVVAVQFDPDQRRLTFSAEAFDPGRHAAELWVIPADGKPRSLGLIDAKTPRSRLSGGDATARIAPGVTLAVSIEPLGGSPTGQPTGPVVLTGIVRKS